MMDTVELLIKNAHCFNADGDFHSDIACHQGKIIELGTSLEKKYQGQEVIDASGLFVIPGVIDSQVHFRDPGLTHKEDLATGPRAALLGGVTTFLEMPNTNPATTTLEELENKVDLAKQKSIVDFGFFIGATGNNLDELVKAVDHPACCGIKIFLGSSTGDLLLTDPQALKEIFSHPKLKDVTIAIHSENEEMLLEREGIKNAASRAHDHPQWRNVDVALSSTQRIVEIARSCGRGLHILHISTAEEIDFLKDHKDLFTLEVTPQHLTLKAPECYDRLGNYAQMNPPIREERHQKRLWQALQEGLVDVIGSDHAPHTHQEKKKNYPHSPSGMPGVQTMLPIMLQHVHDKKLSLSDLVKLLCERPASLYHLQDRGRIEGGLKADLVLLNPQKKQKIENRLQASKCGWTPYDGLEVATSIEAVIFNGQQVVKNERFLGHSCGKMIKE